MSDYPVIALIGPGAIGTTIAAVLHDVGRTPLLWDAPRIRNYACATTRVKRWCPVRY
jgi:glycerol-3-phosphate dehydrogenase